MKCHAALHGMQLHAETSVQSAKTSRDPLRKASARDAAIDAQHACREKTRQRDKHAEGWIYQPISLTMLPMVAPFVELSLDTRLSAGWLTTAQKTPAM